MQEFLYVVKLTRNEQMKITFPNLKNKKMLPDFISFECDQSEYPFDVKIVGKDTLLSITDMVFMYKKSFKLQCHLISDDTIMTIKNIAPPQDKFLYELRCRIVYKVVEPELIFNSTYKNLCVYNTILDDIIKCKNVSHIILFGTDINSIKLIPKCESTPLYYASYTFEPVDNMINIDDNVLLSNIHMYNLYLDGDNEKIGLIVYGFN